jgi:hypothetical protein
VGGTLAGPTIGAGRKAVASATDDLKAYPSWSFTYAAIDAAKSLVEAGFELSTSSWSM